MTEDFSFYCIKIYVMKYYIISQRFKMQTKYIINDKSEIKVYVKQIYHIIFCILCFIKNKYIITFASFSITGARTYS